MAIIDFWLLAWRKQWGQGSVNQNSDATFAFPISFASTQAQVIAVASFPSSNEFENGISVTNITTQNFLLHCQSNKQTIRWIAAGH